MSQDTYWKSARPPKWTALVTRATTSVASSPAGPPSAAPPPAASCPSINACSMAAAAQHAPQQCPDAIIGMLQAKSGWPCWQVLPLIIMTACGLIRDACMHVAGGALC